MLLTSIGLNFCNTAKKKQSSSYLLMTASRSFSVQSSATRQTKSLERYSFKSSLMPDGCLACKVHLKFYIVIASLLPRSAIFLDCLARRMWDMSHLVSIVDALRTIIVLNDHGSIVVLFPRHFTNPETQARTITQIQLFRDYLHYHIKCSKAYMHSRMRARVAEFLKVLNRAKPEEEKERKTASGRTFTRS